MLNCLLLCFEYISANLSGWSKNTSRYVPYYILPNQNTTLIDPIHICGTHKPILLLVIVCSSPINFEKRYFVILYVYLGKRYVVLYNTPHLHVYFIYRRAIRETWANTTEFNYPIFHQMHAKLTGKYLNINDNTWKDFIDINPHSKIGLQNVSCSARNMLIIMKRNENISYQLPILQMYMLLN